MVLVEAGIESGFCFVFSNLKEFFELLLFDWCLYSLVTPRTHMVGSVFLEKGGRVSSSNQIIFLPSGYRNSWHENLFMLMSAN